MTADAGDRRPDRLEAELARSRRRIEDLETLGHTVELLDSTLDPSRLFLLALQIALKVLRGDVALLVMFEADREVAHYLARGEDELTDLDENPSRLASEVLRTGQGGVRRESGSPGAKAAAERIGRDPVLRVAAPLVRGDRVLGALEVGYAEEPEERLRSDSKALLSVAEHLAIALENAGLVREHAQRVHELSLLYDIGTKISAHLDLDEVLDGIVDSFLEVVPADAIGIFLIDRDDGSIRKETLRGYGESDLDEVRLKVGKGILGWVAREGEGILVNDVSQDDRYVGARAATRSEMAVPLTSEGQVIGVFNLESDRCDAFGPHDLELLSTFGTQASISITNAHLHSEVTEKRHLEEQLEVARDIQSRLLPRESPCIEGHSLAGRNIPSSAVGGDYFDFVPLPGGRWAIVVADVSGHGVPAGLIMAGFRTAIRGGLRRSDDPREILSEVNEVLCSELEAEHFVTAILGVYSPDSGTLVYSSAGHEPGLLVRSGGGLERLSEGGLLLGVFPDAVYGQAMIHMSRGDRLLLHTDGLSDTGEASDDLLGEAGILRILREAERSGIPTADLPDEMLRRAEAEHPGVGDVADDRTLVVLARTSSG